MRTLVCPFTVTPLKLSNVLRSYSSEVLYCTAVPDLYSEFIKFKLITGILLYYSENITQQE
jgi:hypothetical protein